MLHEIVFKKMVPNRTLDYQLQQPMTIVLTKYILLFSLCAYLRFLVYGLTDLFLSTKIDDSNIIHDLLDCLDIYPS